LKDEATASVRGGAPVSLEGRASDRDLDVGQRLITRAEDAALDVAGDLLSGSSCGREHH
jgi:hypothetical protein